MVLTGDVTLSVADELKIGKDVDISNSGFVLIFNVNGKAEIDKGSSVSADINSNDKIKLKEGVQFTGNINSAEKVDISKETIVVGDVTAGGELKINDASVVFGNCSPTHPRCTGSGLGSMCTITQIGTGGEEFRGISGSSDSNVIAAGKDGSLYHFDGSDWNKHAFTSDEDLNDVEVVNDSLAYAVGKDGKVIAYDGTNWSTLPVPVDEDLFGVWAASSSEVWVVGKDNTLYLWNGSSWTDMSGVGQANVDNGEDLTDIWGGATYQYSLEKDGDLYRYARPSGPWSKISACGDPTVDLEADDIWGDNSGKIYIAAEDKDDDEASVFLFNEATNSCSKVFGTDTEKEAFGISGNGSTVYAVGKKGLVLDNSSGSWEESFKGFDDFLDVWVSSSGTPYYIGKDGYVTTCTSSSSPALDHFRIVPGSISASTCLPNTITITAEDIDDIPVVDYFNTIDISVSTNHGNWSIDTANGSLSPNPDSDDNGAVSYEFIAADASSIRLDLTNTHAETLDITIYDAIDDITSTLAGVSVSQNIFVITADPIQIAGRPQAMTVAMWTDDTANSGSWGIDTNYNNPAQSLLASVERSGVLPGANAPTIQGDAIVDAPGTTLITLDFSTTSVTPPVVASFSLNTSDVGQYILNMVDTSYVHSSDPISSLTVPGSSPLLTVRPFGLAVTDIIAGATANPGAPIATSPTGTIFTSAGGAFSVTGAGVLWNTRDDHNITGGDGIVDGPGLYDNNAVAPSFAALTNLTVSGSGFTPAAADGGVAGALGNNVILPGEFGAPPPPPSTAGTATITDLQYS
ncbi:MAG: hypothetical protein ACI87H_001126 [Gammaproteobacteria bacterium]